MLNVPFTIADATTLTEAGYVGEDVENIIQKLLQKCDYDVEKAQRGIVYIDEIDKIAQVRQPVDHPRRVGRGRAAGAAEADRGHRRLVPPQGGRKHPQQEFLQVDTTNILFICGGAFAGLDKIIQQRSAKLAASASAPKVKSKERGQVGEVLPGRAGRSDQVRPDPGVRRPPAGGRDAGGARRAALIKILTEPKNALTKQFRSCSRWKASSWNSRGRAGRHRRARRSSARPARAACVRSSNPVLLDTMYDLPSLENVSKVVVDDR
jgi:ATP-dependent Clp protease ATP-binding subunit ClpX